MFLRVPQLRVYIDMYESYWFIITLGCIFYGNAIEVLPSHHTIQTWGHAG
jgi:hypothetical protein